MTTPVPAHLDTLVVSVMCLSLLNVKSILARMEETALWWQRLLSVIVLRASMAHYVKASQ
jgi:hypothetical protein